MALARLKFDQSQTKIEPHKEQFQFAVIDFDLTETEKPSFRNTITQNPTEDGKNISDNIIREPKLLTLNALITNFPLLEGQQVDPSQGFRSKTAYFNILQLRQNRVIFNVQTGLDLYQNMAIANFSPTRNSTNTNALEFQIDFQEVLTATSKIIDVPRKKIKTTPANAKDQAQGTVNKGSQQTTPADSKSASFAAELWDAVFE